MEGQDIRGLIEAYSQVYETPEVLNEEVVEEDVEQLMERGAPTDPKARAAYDAQVAKNRAALGNTLLYGNAAGKKPEAPVTRNRNVRGGGTIKPPAAAAPAKPAAAAPAKPAAAAPAKPAAAAPAKPAAAAPAKPAAAAPKPAVAPAKPAPGTKAAGPESIKPKTPNPLMKDNSIGKMIQASQIRQKSGANVTSDMIGSKSTTAPAPKPQMSARAQALKAGGPAGSARERMLNQDLDLFDIIKGHLLDEGYADSEEGAMVIMVNMSEEWRESIIMELTGGKGHPGYKAGSKDHGDLEDHPAVKKGGVLTPRHGEHLGDLDDEDDEEDELENILKDRSRARREAVRKPLRDKVKAARKKMTKEGYAVTIEDIVKLLDENREHDREMRKAAARERAEEKKEKKEEGKKSAKAPGRLGKSAGSSYADYQEVSIKAHDKATKGKFIPGMVKNEEVELVDESALGTMAVLGGMAAGRAIHGKLEKRKAKKELEAKRKTSDYLIMKDKTKKVVARDRAAGGDTRKEDLEAWVDELIAEGYDLSGYTWEEVAEIYAQELELMDEASYSAKAARAGKDIGKPGKAFAKIAKEAGERYGSKERGEKVAGAVLAKLRKEGYQRDPEKGEEKEDKKYENVRGEKTPMPPRGDKRREAFEKWYAKQMGR